MVTLPIDALLPQILEEVRRRRAIVITAAPGAGKTTRVPPALSVDGPVIVLQPRRVAARSLARRIAEERDWTIGREVGWQVRFERRFSADTRVLLATEGILTARLQQDPLLESFRTIVLDEFHERSIHADLGLALAKQAWRARSDLALVIMSATLDAAPVSSFLDDCPVVGVTGTAHPLEVRYAPGVPVETAARVALDASTGQILCFLPGAGEIARAARGLTSADAPFDVIALHGSQPGEQQDIALTPSERRRVILATNIAETSLTVPGVTAVVDSGLHKAARYDPSRGIDSLAIERISQDSADQRAGRAGRVGPGLAIRLWDRLDRLRPHREPELRRVDLSGPLLDVLAWGGTPDSLEWLEAPSQDAVESAFALLERLGATHSGQLTRRGREMQRLPLHPRLASILLEGSGKWRVALACAVLAERGFVRPAGSPATTGSDVIDMIDRQHELSPHVTSVARALQRLVLQRDEAARGEATDAELCRALFAGYPDRVARRRQPGSSRVVLASGHGAVVGPDSGVREGEYLVALDVMAGRPGVQSEAQIRLASVVDAAWLVPTETRTDHYFDADSGTVRAVRRDYYGGIVLTEHPLSPDPSESARLLAAALVERGLDEGAEQLVNRMRFAGLSIDVSDLAMRAAIGARALAQIELRNGLDWNERTRLDELAPATLSLPSGRSTRLEYRRDGEVAAAVKLQELFGLAATPRVGRQSAPVLLHLLAPNGRPVQTTRDLTSFWSRTYPEVRKELRGRYPRHPWPADPWTAPPTARTTRRGVK